MDAEKLETIRALFEDEIREQVIRDLIKDLELPGPEEEREWAEFTAGWLRENYL